MVRAHKYQMESITVFQLLQLWHRNQTPEPIRCQLKKLEIYKSQLSPFHRMQSNNLPNTNTRQTTMVTYLMTIIILIMREQVSMTVLGSQIVKLSTIQLLQGTIQMAMFHMVKIIMGTIQII